MLMGLLDVWTHAGRSNRARKKDEWSSTMMHLCYRLTILLPKLPFAHLLITKSSDCVSVRTYDLIKKVSYDDGTGKKVACDPRQKRHHRLLARPCVRSQERTVDFFS
jgi:hypothetical protein